MSPPGKPKPHPQPGLEIAEALSAVAPLVSRWMERLLAGAEPPLTVSQYLALRAIAREEIVAADLARRAAVSGPAVSQLLSALVKAGLVERSPAAGDRRRQALTLTAAGDDAYRAGKELLRRELGGLLGGLPKPEADALGRALPQLEALLSGTPPPRRPGPPPPPQPKKGPAKH
jgi:DNA-binding MarR family transcriptional regulator